MLRIFFFLSLGVGAAGAALEIATGDPGYSWIWPAALPFAILSGTLVLVSRSLRSVAPPSSGDTAAALASGRGALAVITNIRRTGTAINDVPVCELTLVVAPRDRAAYTTTTRFLIDPVAMLRFQPGAVKVVGRYALDRPEVWIVAEPDATWRNAPEEGADTIPREAPVWKAAKDADPVGKQPLLGTVRKSLPLRIALYALAFVVGVGAVLAPTWEQFSVAASGMLNGEDPEDFVRGDRQQVAIDALVELAGPQFTEIHFYNGFVSATAPTSPGAMTIDDFQYRWAEVEREGASNIQPDNLAKLLFDVRDVNVNQVQTIVADAMRATGIDDPDPHVILRRSSPLGENEDTPGPLEFDVNLSDDYYQGDYLTDANGKMIDMYGGHPGSDAYVAEHAED